MGSPPIVPGELLRIPIEATEEDQAWETAESALGGVLSRISATKKWVDLSWLLRRIPRTPELVWHLDAVDNNGVRRRAFVRDETNELLHMDGDATFFAVPQEHHGYRSAGPVYWARSLAGSESGCFSPGPSCTQPAFSISLSSREIMPPLVDIWYTQSTTNTAPLAWPHFSQQTRPLDNRGLTMKVVAADGIEDDICAFTGSLCSKSGTVFIPAQNGTTIKTSQAEPDLLGHEYAHSFVRELKAVLGWMPNDPGQKITWQFTEALCDLYGIVSEDMFFRTNKPSARTDFAIDPKNALHSGVDWVNRDYSDCANVRRDFGRAFYLSFADWTGLARASTPDLIFDIWWLEITRSLALAREEYPDFADLYAAAVARSPVNGGCPPSLGLSPVSVFSRVVRSQPGLAEGCRR